MSNTSPPSELFTSRTLFSLGGSSAAVWLFTTILASTLGIDTTEHYKWVGLCVSVPLSFIGVFTREKFNVRLSTVALFNGLLIYVTATGIDSINNGVRGAKESTSASIIPFTTAPWWPAVVLIDSIKSYQTENVKLKEEKASLQIRVNQLMDSIATVDMPRMNLPVVNTSSDLEDCIRARKKLEDDLKKCDDKLKLMTGGDKTQQFLIARADQIRLLGELKNLNKNLLESLEEYLGAGELNPKGQAKALKNINERIGYLRNDIENYNTRLDELIANTK